MPRPRGLSGRLALLYAAALIAGLGLFAVFALLTIDRVQRTSIDAALATEAATAATLVVPESDSSGLDAEQINAFRHSVGAYANGALFDAGGRLKLTTVIDLPDAIAALASAPAGAARDVAIDGVRERAVVAPVVRAGKTYGRVVLWRPSGDVADVDRRAALGFAIAIPLVTLAALAAGRGLARRALRPLRDLAALTAEIEAVDLSRRIGESGDDELGTLCATFDRMLARLEESFQRQRRFAGDVAHEVRAPLAVVIAEIDIARRRPRVPAEYERVLETIREKALALDRLATDLLASYRDDAPPVVASFALRDALAEAAAKILPLAAAHDISIELHTECDTNIVADQPEIVRALVAILDNARKYGGDGRTIVATIDADEYAARAVIRDGGAGFTVNALARATERFWRDTGTHGRDGAGLGLALARALTERAGGILELTNADTGGGVVTLIFPRAPK
jgi:signal transduction histidine kinase